MARESDERSRPESSGLSESSSRSEKTDDHFSRPQGWLPRFANAFRGIGGSVKREASFRIHLPCAIAVIAAATLTQMPLMQWAILLGCMAQVLTAELLNTALEAFGRAIDRRFNSELKRGLDAASGAVLISALGAATIGCLLFVHRSGQLMQWW